MKQIQLSKCAKYGAEPKEAKSGVQKYLLSKTSVKKIIDLYFNREITTYNNTKDTKQHKQHKITQTTQKKIDKENNKENVRLCAVCVVNPEVDNSKIDFPKSNIKEALEDES